MITIMTILITSCEIAGDFGIRTYYHLLRDTTGIERVVFN